jgi:hypothetical protein
MMSLTVSTFSDIIQHQSTSHNENESRVRTYPIRGTVKAFEDGNPPTDHYVSQHTRKDYLSAVLLDMGGY